MIQELDTVVLTHPLPEYGLERGDVGAVVHVYQDEVAYEIEFVNAAGRTMALITVKPGDIRAMDAEEILHVRALSAKAA